MLCLKKLYREELLQLALLLSLLRVDPESYLGLDIQAMGVGSLDLHNGSGWHTDAHTIVHRPMFVHPKNLDSVLLNYERDLFEELNSLGRYNRMNSGSNDIHAYLLNIEDTGRNAATAGSSLPISTETSSNMTSPDSSSSSQQPAEPIGAAELTQEDMDLIEVLWKQDVDLGFTLVEPTSTTSKKKVATACEKESEDEIEKLKALEAINATNQKEDAEGVEVKHQQDDDPWAGRNYTVDLETGEYILSTCNQNGNSEVEEDNQFLREQSFGLNHHPLAGFPDDSLGLNETLGLENDFTSELLNDSLLGGTVVEDLLGGNDLGLPDGFNLEEALQLVGLDEVNKPENEETNYELKKEKVKQEIKKEEELVVVEENDDGKRGRRRRRRRGGGGGGGGGGGRGESNGGDKVREVEENEDEDDNNIYDNNYDYDYDYDDNEDEDHENDEYEEEEEEVVGGSKEFTSAKGDVPVNVSSNVVEVAKSSRCEDPETGDMIHTPQFHHPHHPHHRSFQGRMPFVRAMSMEQRWQDLASLLSLPGAPEHFAHPSHPGYHPGHTISHSHYEAQRNVLLHNATLAPPVGDLNSTGPYHNVGGSSNLGSAVATSMNLTNSSEPMGAESNAAYKSEPTDIMYYHAPTSDTINQTTDGFLSSLLNDEDLHLMDMAMNDGMYTMRMLDNGSNNASGPTGAAALPGVQTAGGTTSTTTALTSVTSLPAVTDERMDASSDSAVSSMGSERVPSLSDGEWMETGSNSSHTQADSHYTMDYASKYRMPYDCSYSVSGRNAGSPRCQPERTVPPVAQKKHQMFAKRYFQEQGTGSPLGGTAHPTTPMKYEYDSHTVGAGAPGNAYSGPIEGAAGPQSEIKYSCSVDFTRHQSGRSAIEHVHHNHTYHLPAESSGSLQRPLSRDKKVRKNESDEHLTRDEKRARALNVPIPVNDIINLPMDEFNERLSKYDLSEAQLSLIRDIRRRGKNKVAAQNCRKRKLDQIISLADEVKEMRDRKLRLIREHDFMLLERQRVKDKFSQLYRHVFQSLRDPDGNQYHPYEYSLQQSADGNVLLVPRNQTNPHHPCPSSMEPKTKPDPEHKE